MDRLSGASPESSARDLGLQNPSLEAGLAALKSKNYRLAIAHLEAICQSATHRTLRIKAQMGLVKAYERVGNFKWAIALCQSLRESSNPEVRQWADHSLVKLNQRYASTRSLSPQEADSNPSGDQTGFVPFTAETHLSSNTTLQTDFTGFLPFEDDVEISPETQLPHQTATEPTDPVGTHSVSAQTDSPAAIASPSETLERYQGDPTNPTNPTNPTTFSAEHPINPTLTRSMNVDVSDVTANSDVEISAVADESRVDVLQPASTANTTNARSIAWRQAARALKWNKLGKIDLTKLWGLEALTVAALIYLIVSLLKWLNSAANWLMLHITWPLDLRGYLFYSQPLNLVMLVLGVLFCASPWLLDVILRFCYGSQPLSPDLLNRYTPETVRTIKRICSTVRLPLPQLSLLTTSAPIVLTYGNLPQTARIAISQGMLEQLRSEEVAAICAAELGHIAHWDFAILSWLTLVIQLPYLIYRSLTTWGDRQRYPIVRSLAALIAALSYGLFWLLRGVGLWLSRVRVYYSDRFASESTGDPNALTRGLLKLCLGTTQEIRRQKQTPYLLESFDLLTPIGYRTALLPGSAVVNAFEPLLQWDRLNPYRRWFAFSQAHPPLGDRLQLLALYARHWRLDTELEFPIKPPDITVYRRPTEFILQISHLLGLLLGMAIAYFLWLLGSIANQFGWLSLSWMAGDRSLLWGLSLIGLSIGSLLRINRLFPDIHPSSSLTEANLPDLFTDPALMPLDSQPVRLQGKLLGRSGLNNNVDQDLVLQTDQGLLQLQYCPRFGLMSQLFSQRDRPAHWVNTSVTVSGWFRRGAAPWIEVDRIQPQQGRGIKGHSPLWSTVVATLAALWGAYLISQGGV